MSEFLLLFAVLAAIYIFDCICAVPLSCFPIAFTGRNWKPATTIIVLSGRARRLVLSPFLPGAGVAICSDAPLSWDGNGICATTKPHGAEHKHLSINNPVSAEGADLVLARELIATCASPQTAERLAQQVRELTAAPVQDRPAMVESGWRRQFDLRSLRRRLRTFEVFRRHLATDSWIVLLLLFLLAPIALLMFGPLSLLMVAVIMLLMMSDIIYLYCRCFRKLWPHDSLPWRHLLAMILTPPAVMRASDYLVRELLSEFHWIAVITAVGNHADNDRLLARYVRRLEHPAPWEQLDCKVGQEARQMWKKTVFEFVETHGGRVADLLREPTRESEHVSVFCPRCTAQFVKDGKCSDCGVELKTFA
jgi:hypothetical protein